MKPEAQRIAIAEACGWKHIGTAKHLPLYGWIKVGPLLEIPDYPNDLNAMHEAVKTLLFTKRQEYYRELQCVRGRNAGLQSWEAVAFQDCIESTAAQRAEAFLRTIGKWSDSQ